METSDHPHTSNIERAEAIWLLPSHRLPVLLKTPAIVAIGCFTSGGNLGSSQTIAILTLSTFLWAALYALNEWTDLREEQGLDPPLWQSRLLILTSLLICAIAIAFSHNAGLLLLLMSLGQMIYCLKPFRVKRYWFGALLLSGIINPALRLECGGMLGSHLVPTILVISVISLHIGAATRSRCTLRKRDSSFGYHTAPLGLELFGILFTTIGHLTGIIASVEGILPHIFIVFLIGSALFSCYAWSDKKRSISELRRGWLWFALVAVLALGVMAILSK